MTGIIGIDWGTTCFRAYHIRSDGSVRQKIETDAGILDCHPGEHAEVLHRQLTLFGKIEADQPMIASGMITSRQGWLETPYIKCPCGIQALADGLCPLDIKEYRNLWFVPGVMQSQPEPDIMRGEETQLFGLDVVDHRTCLLPGTHSKWVTMEKGRIVRFATYMTGDLFDAVLQRTVLRSTIEGEWSDEAFEFGVETGFQRSKQGRGLLSGLFQMRVRDILHLRPALDTRSVLSGLLVGCEIAEAGSCFLQAPGPVLVIGNEQLTRIYLLALAVCGIEGAKGPDNAAATGIYRIARLTPTLQRWG